MFKKKLNTLKYLLMKIIPFTYDDREQFRGKWIQLNTAGKEVAFKAFGQIPAQEHQIISVARPGISLVIGLRVVTVSYLEASQQFEFIDGTPFGKVESLIIAKN